MIWLMGAAWWLVGYGLAVLTLKMMLGEVWVKDLFLCVLLAVPGPLLLLPLLPLIVEAIPSGWLKKKIF